MDRRINITRHEYGMTIADDRTGLRVEVFEYPDGLSIEAYGYHSAAPQPTMDVYDPTEIEVPEGRVPRSSHPQVTFRMPDPKPVTRTRAR